MGRLRTLVTGASARGGGREGEKTEDTERPRGPRGCCSWAFWRSSELPTEGFYVLRQCRVLAMTLPEKRLKPAKR